MDRKFVLTVAYEESLAEVLEALREVAPSMRAKVLEESGPSGGWPEVEFTVAESELEAFAEASGYELDELA